ncbi:2-hydroxyacyl-CoA dehydratase family protein [bacterium]|nr:2-hydroxyacyl-CoA dehydratase family protein [bacterium]
MTTQQDKKPNRLKSVKIASQLVDGYWDDLIKAKEQGKLVCYTTGGAVGPFLAAQDMAWIHGEAYGARVASRHEEKEPQIVAERRGYNREVCSYARTQIGCTMLSNLGIPEDLSPGPIASAIPAPDLIVTCYPGCSTGPQWDWSVQRLFKKKIPWYNVSIPFYHGGNDAYMSGQNYLDQVEHLTQQFEGLVKFLEDVSGRPFNWDKFREWMAVTKKVAQLRNETMELCKAKPSPASFFDWSILMSPVNYLSGWPGTVECMEAVKAEVQERVKNNISYLPNEKYRLIFMGIMNWNKIGWLAKKFASFDACIIAGEYTHLGFWNEPDLIDIENPLEGIAINNLIFLNNLGFPLQEYRMHKVAREFAIDGVVMHAARTCRGLVLAQNLHVESFRRKMNISSIMFEGDMVDESFYQDEIVNTRIEALIESLDAQKSRNA